ncbi:MULTISPECIES: MarR family winged helix-turn-helix transcriptional regulator [unclassified Cryobacterium]|uniref:MarR family winged helix-turn-helix transcriptional regulator n=1 Tax=unclassified Cryobacterium TaxID=2649013 RepID=UPI000CE4D372|nr:MULTISPECIES: MarR family winged helix-turn-helix transcriptional regulator [unclassified Cryobacterium]TFD07069.1 MarR family transcriptional regulator [Cryobacterium sp. TMT1-66-1]TFD13372.1 MarR family transcriptional regulator [Cryobacterium sp. TMT1-2-2]
MNELVERPSVDGDTLELARVEAQMAMLAANIRASTRSTAAVIDPTLEPFGLALLRVLARRGESHASVVADVLAVDRSMISRQAKLLCSLGLVETRVDPLDGRARFLALTPLATEKLAEVRRNRTALVHRRLSRWTPAELDQFATLLERLNEPD